MDPYDARHSFGSLEKLLKFQSGAVSRGQVLHYGESDNDIRRRVRRGEWQRVLPGVFVEHPGPLSWEERAWAGVLFWQPAGLGSHAALHTAVPRTWRHFSEDDPIEIVVPTDRHVEPHPGYRITRISDFDHRVRRVGKPPALVPDHAALAAAASTSREYDAVAVLADAVQARVVSATSLRRTLTSYSRLRHGAFLRAALDDLAAGVCSSLEHRHLVDVERAHGLPAGTRQSEVRQAGRRQLRDVLYEPYGVVVELDGAMFHNHAAQRDVDLDRDLDDAATGRRTVRLGWGQVVDRPCRTALRLAAVLRAAGWDGRPRPCGATCAASAAS